MELEARRFARKVLLIHAALLCLLLVVVAAAVHLMYGSARQQALDQAKHTQELLAKQTALGIQNYYQTVSDVMNLLQPGAQEPAPQPRTATFARDLGVATWSSIRNKATSLFVVDPAHNIAVVNVIGVARDSATPESLVEQTRPWLQSVRATAISPYVKLESGGTHLLAVPLNGPDNLLLVAAIPVASLERDVLQYVNNSSTAGAMLVDDAGTFVSATQARAVGRNITELTDPHTRELARKLREQKFSGTLVFEREEKLDNVSFRPGMSTIQPVDVLGRLWVVVVSSNLSEVEGFVKPIFRDAMIWAGFVMIAATTLTVSTAVQLIRGRMRMERMERQVLAKEVAEARQIQLHWLPKGTCMTQSLQVAAINEPATHISGDFYNWFELDDGRIVVTIGDVTGHGMAAAFLMATVQLLVRNIMPRVSDPGACLEEINRQLCMQTFNGQFVTLLILVLDPAKCTMRAASAGHPAPLVGQGEGFAPLPVEPQLVLGVETTEYTSQRFDLSAGQSIVLYTDGAIDVQRPDGQRFSTEGLAASLYGRFDSADSIISTLQNAVDEFRDGRELGDDLTLVAVQLMPEPAAVAAAS